VLFYQRFKRFFFFFFKSEATQISWMVLQVSNPSVLQLFLESLEKGIGASTREGKNLSLPFVDN
jgi:hypothetical protein